MLVRRVYSLLVFARAGCRSRCAQRAAGDSSERGGASDEHRPKVRSTLETLRNSGLLVLLDGYQAKPDTIEMAEGSAMHSAHQQFHRGKKDRRQLGDGS